MQRSKGRRKRRIRIGGLGGRAHIGGKRGSPTLEKNAGNVKIGDDEVILRFRNLMMTSMKGNYSIDLSRRKLRVMKIRKYHHKG